MPDYEVKVLPIEFVRVLLTCRCGVVETLHAKSIGQIYICPACNFSYIVQATGTIDVSIKTVHPVEFTHQL